MLSKNVRKVHFASFFLSKQHPKSPNMNRTMIEKSSRSSVKLFRGVIFAHRLSTHTQNKTCDKHLRRAALEVEAGPGGESSGTYYLPGVSVNKQGLQQ